jgi:uncharacterized protein
MQSMEEQGLIIARLFSGEDLFQSLREVCRKHEVENAIIISAIGQIKQFTLGYLNGKTYSWQEFVPSHELVSISGIISWSREEQDYQFHLHAAVADEKHHAFGGHLAKGIVQTSNEIVILKTHLKVKRRLDEQTGLPGLFLDEEKR